MEDHPKRSGSTVGDPAKGKRKAKAKGGKEDGISTTSSGSSDHGSGGVSGNGGASGSGVGDACDRRRAASSMEQLWRVYASVSHRELQFQSTSGMFKTVRMLRPPPRSVPVV